MVRTKGGADLPGYVRSLLAEVIERTGYPVVTSETGTAIDYDSELSMARQSQPFHKLVHSADIESSISTSS